MILLFLSEFTSFVQVKTSSELLVDMNRKADKLKINIDITMMKLPCSIVSIDVQDIMGTHTLNVHGTIVKTRVDKDERLLEKMVEIKKEGGGAVVSHDGHSHEHVEQPNYDEVKNAVLAGEGCNLKGQLEVLRVPGNFHISSHAFGDILGRLQSEGVYKFDISHKINHLSFGSEDNIINIKNKFNVGILNPIDGVIKKQIETNKVYEYYLKVVPTTYADIDGNTYNVHQFTSNSNEITAQMMVPTVFFRYDISPILVRIEQYKQSLFHFFIQICAIIGGMYSVTGILDSLIHRLLRKTGPKSD
jgi:hypothetical protein